MSCSLMMLFFINRCFSVRQISFPYSEHLNPTAKQQVGLANVGHPYNLFSLIFNGSVCLNVLRFFFLVCFWAQWRRVSKGYRVKRCYLLLTLGCELLPQGLSHSRLRSVIELFLFQKAPVAKWFDLQPLKQRVVGRTPAMQASESVKKHL